MTTLTIGLLILVFVVFMYMMMTRKGGGCCGTTTHQETPKGGGCCGGGGPPESHDHQELENTGTTIDPVCGMTVDEKSGLSSEHHGKHYALCSEHCRKSFDADPGKYV